MKKKFFSLSKLQKRLFKKKKSEARYYEVVKDLKITRKLLDLTQTELAQLADVSRSTIARIESGEENVELETLLRLATAMNKKLEIKLS